MLDPCVRSSQPQRMSVEQLRSLHQSRALQPFDIHLADGRSLPVDHPEFLAITPPGRTIGVALHDGTIDLVDRLLFTSLKPKSNGTHSRHR